MQVLGSTASSKPAPIVRSGRAARSHVSGHARRKVQLRAAMGEPNYEPYTVVAKRDELEGMSAADIKAALLDSFWGTERGLAASSETRAEINELITQLEAQSPNPKPNEAMNLLDGSWKLMYTSNSELIALLAMSKLPFVTIDDITQSVDSSSLTVENRMVITVPGSRTAFSTTAALEVRSPQRLQLKFEKGTVSTPQLMTDLELPDNFTVMGQNIDLTQVKSALSPVRSAGRDFVSQVANLVRQQPDLDIPIGAERAQTWLLTTYLDEDTRISRGDGGSIFVLVKEVNTSPPRSISEYDVAGFDETVDLTA